MPRLISVCLLLAACSGDDAPSKDEPTDGDTDTDTDSDSDADSDTDVPDVDSDGDGFLDALDCAPTDPEAWPGAPDVCGDDRVTDCDRASDDGLVTVGTFTTTDLALALAEAVAGDEVLVCAGTHAGPFAATVPLVIAAHGSSAATLSGSDSGTALEVVSGSTLRGLTLTGGNADEGGGLRLVDAGELTVEGCTVTGNRAVGGAGISIPAGATLTLVDSDLSGNVATVGGGGLSLGEGAIAVLENTTVHDNEAFQGGGVSLLPDSTLEGGGVSANRAEDGAGLHITGPATIDGVEITTNEASGSGGGLSVDGDAFLSDCAVTENTAADGGGLSVLAGTLTLSSDTHVAGNEATGAGGGITVFGGTIQGGEIADNTAAEGGGLRLFDSSARATAIRNNHAVDGGGVWATCPNVGCGTDVVVDTEISGNTATGDGGGLWITRADGEQAVLEHDTFSANGASSGGGIYATETDVWLLDTELVLNTATSGAGLTVRDGDLLVEIAIVTGNVASADGGGALVVGDSSLVSVDSDWGTDADDNLPSDVDYLGVSYAVPLGDFACTAGGCD